MALLKERPEGDKGFYRPLVARIINKGEKNITYTDTCITSIRISTTDNNIVNDNGSLNAKSGV